MGGLFACDAFPLPPPLPSPSPRSHLRYGVIDELRQRVVAGDEEGEADGRIKVTARNRGRHVNWGGEGERKGGGGG